MLHATVRCLAVGIRCKSTSREKNMKNENNADPYGRLEYRGGEGKAPVTKTCSEGRWE